MCPVPITRSSGTSSSQRVGRLNGQRVWKAQPDGGFAGDGRSPGSTMRRAVGGDGRVGHRHRRQQRHRVRVQRAVEHVVAGAELDDAAEVHHRDPVAEVLHDGEVVGHEHQREVEPALQVAQQVEDLRLDRHVEGRHRLVGDEERGSTTRARAMPIRWRWPPLN